MTMTLETALSGDAVALVQVLTRTPYFAGSPVTTLVDYETIPVPDDWRRLVGDGRWPIQVEYQQPLRRLLIEPKLVTLTVADVPRQQHVALGLLEQLPFEVASFATIHPSWRSGDAPYHAPGFSDGHMPHGWACAFRGRGHERLVSRRWLRAGPWQLIERRDLSFVQFHKLELDAAAALEEARPGHARMGITPEGGYLASDYVYAHDVKGHYLPQQRTLKIFVSHRDVSQQEMLDACAARREQALGPEQPIDTIGFVFMEEERARRHLRELWLRELQCYAMIKGVETRLDEGTEPRS